MDTNLKKDKHNKLISTSWGILLIGLIIAVISVAIYVPIKDAKSKDDVQKFLESHEFIYTLGGLTHYLIQTEIEHQDTYRPHYNNLENIKYYWQDKDNKPLASNMEGQSRESEIKNSQFYLHIITDDQGKPTIESAPNWFKKGQFIAYLSHLLQPDTENEALYLANLDIVYTVPQKLTNNNDLFIRDLKEYTLIQDLLLILLIGGISILLLTILTFALPYSAQKQASLVKVFNKLYLELKLIIWLAFFLICLGILSLITSTNNAAINYLNIIHDANVYFYAIGIPVTLIFYTLIYLSITNLKHIYHVGIKEGLIKNSLFGKLSFYVIKSVKRTLKQVVEVDITDSNQQLFKLLGLNLIVLIIIALTGGFGVFLALVYTALLFNYLLKVLDKARALNEASSQLAKGNFDIVLPADMEILSPFAKNLSNIKEGFKVAVDKEIKSQNMKTELISNVSHDLKTPLTSIITYVDLLKNEDLEKETQREYIRVLDEKSKRLQVLIEDLFEASKASSGNIEMNLEPVDVVALLRQTMGEMEERINDSSLQMKVKLPENKVICQLDGARTYRVFENIISNILKYSMPNTRVYIDAVENEKEISFVFKNISAYEMNFEPAKIIERSFRGDKSRNTEGSGLGLAIAKSFVDLQEGQLDIIIDGDLFKLRVTFPKAG
ncbi:sensor histidine kinase [Desulfofalx alkaliphila]|uniref:sensor histidine kinase n=1 Tax=Desulfofalx alkaliphila TaxID=105483 RepID=UPI0004E13F3E|nr:sensor histidine kinase [Desulfofalx alkaliphila]